MRQWRRVTASAVALRRCSRPSPANGAISDIARVTLDIEARGDMGWVVVNDPIPAGATLLNRGFGSDSLAAGVTAIGAWPQYVEMRTTPIAPITTGCRAVNGS